MGEGDDLVGRVNSLRLDGEEFQAEGVEQAAEGAEQGAGAAGVERGGGVGADHAEDSAEAGRGVEVLPELITKFIRNTIFLR